jgi:hypothetical protein
MPCPISPHKSQSFRTVFAGFGETLGFPKRAPVPFRNQDNTPSLSKLHFDSFETMVCQSLNSFRYDEAFYPEHRHPGPRRPRPLRIGNLGRGVVVPRTPGGEWRFGDGRPLHAFRGLPRLVSRPRLRTENSDVTTAPAKLRETGLVVRRSPTHNRHKQGLQAPPTCGMNDAQTSLLSGFQPFLTRSVALFSSPEVTGLERRHFRSLQAGVS